MTVAADTAAGGSRQARSIDWPKPGMRVVALLVATAMGAILALRGLQTPEPAPADSDSFSAIRASKFARALLGEQPRPSGSEAVAQASQRLVDWLRVRGLDVESSEARVRANGRDLTLRNVMARKTGAMPGPAILLCAHIDSANGSPGASDDGFGVAVLLELGAALGTGPWPGRDIILLFTDGEEAGLLGARQFVSNHPWQSKVGAVVNVDNRGNSGPSILYDLCGDSADLLQSCSVALGPVVGSSLYSEIAARMPNSSDLSVFREAGMTGMNFAVVGGHQHYHAPTDDWSNADLSSLQHQGEVVLQAVQALAAHRADTPKAEGRAVYQDLAGWVLAWWPARTGVTISVMCVLLLGASGLMVARRSGGNLRDMVAGWLAALLRFVVAGVVCWGLLRICGLAGLFGMEAAKAGMPEASLADRYRAAFWPDFGPILLGTSILAGIAAGWLAARPLLRGREPMRGFIGAWGALAVLTAIVASVLPGASAPLLPVTLLSSVALAGTVFALEGRERTGVLVAMAVGGFMTGLMLTPIVVLSWTGVGLSMPEFTGLQAAVLALVLLPALSQPAAATR